uniref:Uncharacterized protein n=1 Tax=Picea glauca TaxID=3330 RepID=A0A101LXB9_PICGL|nr:hypothetical protein ABT39_MTgene6078 [Picea glauca]
MHIILLGYGGAPIARKGILSTCRVVLTLLAGISCHRSWLRRWDACCRVTRLTPCCFWLLLVVDRYSSPPIRLLGWSNTTRWIICNAPGIPGYKEQVTSSLPTDLQQLLIQGFL